MTGADERVARTGWSVAAGAAGAVGGLAPWWLTGSRLPLQNLWTTPAAPDEMPVALLPASQYAVTSIAALLVVGGVLSGVLGRRLARSRGEVAAVVLAALGVQLVVVVQTFTVLRSGLGLAEDPPVADPRAHVYWWGLLAGTVAVLLVSVGVTWLVVRGSRLQAGLGLVLAAVPLGSWLGLWGALVGGDGGPPTWTSEAVRWGPAVVVALALLRCGLGSGAHLVVWVAGAAALVVLPPVVTAVSSALGTRVLDGDVAQTLAVAAEVLRASAGTGVVPAAAAVTVAAGGAALRGSRIGARAGL